MNPRQYTLLMKIAEIVEKSIVIDGGKPPEATEPTQPTRPAGPGKDPSTEFDSVLTASINEELERRRVQVEREESATEPKPITDADLGLEIDTEGAETEG